MPSDKLHIEKKEGGNGFPFFPFGGCVRLHFMSLIYLDNAATTPPLPALGDVWTECAAAGWYNPSALYRQAGAVNQRIEDVRRVLLGAFGAGAHRCLFTSGGTEGANLVVREGVSRRRGGNYVCAGFEHPCVEESFRALQAAGADVRFAAVDAHGRSDPAELLRLVDENTLLVSCMHVNNETGARNPVEALAAAVKRRNPRTLVHVDGVQAYLRTPLRDAGQIDYYTVSAHKVHALKGVGAVFWRDGAPLKPLLRGGGQERGLRSGTENTLGIFAFGAAVEAFEVRAAEIRTRLGTLNRMLREGIGLIPGSCVLSPPPEESCDHILSVSFPGLRGETLTHMLEDAGFLVSTGAACSSHKKGSRAQKALGLPADTAAGAIRISLGVQNREDEIDQFLAALRLSVAQLRRTLGVHI